MTQMGGRRFSKSETNFGYITFVIKCSRGYGKFPLELDKLEHYSHLVIWRHSTLITGYQVVGWNENSRDGLNRSETEFDLGLSMKFSNRLQKSIFWSKTILNILNTDAFHKLTRRYFNFIGVSDWS